MSFVPPPNDAQSPAFEPEDFKASPYLHAAKCVLGKPLSLATPPVCSLRAYADEVTRSVRPSHEWTLSFGLQVDPVELERSCLSLAQLMRIINEDFVLPYRNKDSTLQEIYDSLRRGVSYALPFRNRLNFFFIFPDEDIVYRPLGPRKRGAPWALSTSDMPDLFDSAELAELSPCSSLARRLLPERKVLYRGSIQDLQSMFECLRSTKRIALCLESDSDE